MTADGSNELQLIISMLLCHSKIWKAKLTQVYFQCCKLEYGLAMVASLTDSSLVGIVVYQMVTWEIIYTSTGDISIHLTKYLLFKGGTRC